MATCKEIMVECTASMCNSNSLETTWISDKSFWTGLRADVTSWIIPPLPGSFAGILKHMVPYVSISYHKCFWRTDTPNGPWIQDYQPRGYVWLLLWSKSAPVHFQSIKKKKVGSKLWLSNLITKSRDLSGAVKSHRDSSKLTQPDYLSLLTAAVLHLRTLGLHRHLLSLKSFWNMSKYGT